MFAITIFFGSAGAFQGLFRQEDKARSAQAALAFNPATALGATEWIAIADDFGQELCIERSKLNGYIFENLDQTKLAHVERALHQQRTQNLAQKTADSDPGLRAHRTMNGPAMLGAFGPRGN